MNKYMTYSAMLVWIVLIVASAQADWPALEHAVSIPENASVLRRKSSA